LQSYVPVQCCCRSIIRPSIIPMTGLSTSYYMQIAALHLSSEWNPVSKERDTLLVHSNHSSILYCILCLSADGKAWVVASRMLISDRQLCDSTDSKQICFPSHHCHDLQTLLIWNLLFCHVLSYFEVLTLPLVSENLPFLLCHLSACLPDHLKCFQLFPGDPRVYMAFVFPCLVASLLFFHVSNTRVWNPEPLNQNLYLLLFPEPLMQALLLQSFSLILLTFVYLVVILRAWSELCSFSVFCSCIYSRAWSGVSLLQCFLFIHCKYLCL